MIAKALVWLRNDLRLADNPALHAAFKLGGAITALLCMSPIRNCVTRALPSVGGWNRAWTCWQEVSMNEI